MLAAPDLCVEAAANIAVVVQLGVRRVDTAEEVPVVAEGSRMGSVVQSDRIDLLVAGWDMARVLLRELRWEFAEELLVDAVAAGFDSRRRHSGPPLASQGQGQAALQVARDWHAW